MNDDIERQRALDEEMWHARLQLLSSWLVLMVSYTTDLIADSP